MASSLYALAHDLRGFPSSTIRVKVIRVEPGYVWVRTASLMDSGTMLVLDPAQVELLDAPMSEQEVRHRDGLVTFEGGL